MFIEYTRNFTGEKVSINFAKGQINQALCCFLTVR